MSNTNFRSENINMAYVVSQQSLELFKQSNNSNDSIFTPSLFVEDFIKLYSGIEKMYTDLIQISESNSKSMQLKDGSIFYGQLENGVPHGWGRSILLQKNKKLYYIGYWKNGYKNHFGLVKTNDFVSLGAVDKENKQGYNCVLYTSDNNNNNFLFTRGNFLDDNLEGKALIVYKNNMVYKGETHLSKKHGRGLIAVNSTTSSFTKIIGSWINNNLVGTAIFYRNDGCNISSYFLPKSNPNYKANPSIVNDMQFCHSNPYIICLPNLSQYSGQCLAFNSKISFNYLEYYSCTASPNKYKVDLKINEKLKKKYLLPKNIKFESNYHVPGNLGCVPHGIGTYTDPICTYRGYFNKGKYNGYGFLKNNFGDIKYYHGEFKNNMKHGHGYIRFSFNLTNSARLRLNDDCAIISTKTYKTVMANNKYNYYSTNNVDCCYSPSQKYASVLFDNDSLIKINNFIDVDNFCSNKSLSIDNNGQIVVRPSLAVNI